MLTIASMKQLYSPPAKCLVALAISASLALSGCTTTQLQSRVELPPQFTTISDTTEAELAWWERYADPVLTQLITRAVNENRDIKIAEERVRAARAGVAISNAAMLPSLSATASADTNSNGYSAQARQGAPEVTSFSGGLGVAWELDLTGRLRAGKAAAAADVRASEAHVRGVRLLVVAEVASNYFTLMGAIRQLDTVTAIAQTQQQTLQQVTARQQAGLASPFDVERARTEASRAEAAIPPLQTLVAVSRHRIAVLMGDLPTAAAALSPATAIQVPEVIAGQPAALLERRPDLLAQRAQLDAANWRRQQAKLEWFPKLFVNALFGRQNLEINGMDLSSARFGNVAGLLSMPVFDWGRTAAINDMAQSAQSEALLRYEDAIVRALEDVENALVSLRDERHRSQVLDTAALSAQAALQHAESLYHRGQIDLLPLLDAQRARLGVQISANDSQTQLLLSSVQLFKSLGGGWQAFEAAPASTKDTVVTQHQTSINKESL
ncbi:TolC family protein [Rheinheimera muenzenbergensis]|uniref:TolC family protein n=1 Tax=Rheinheimera muenzenbergensis TaxID=1193628 RepID=A0ABU8C1I9_9GAMM